HLMAYVEMLGRDRGRFADCRRRLNESPLGAAALAGTAVPIDRDRTATALGFDRPAANSIDAVSDRDFAVEFLAAAALAGTHLSRFAEEVVIWSSDAFGLIRLSDAFTTGSSIVPQKRNPDAAELVRAKTGLFNGALIALLTVMKGLPLAYQKDMQEDKVPVFEAADTLELCLAAMTGLVRDMRPDRERLREAAARGFSTATDLADWLVRTLDLPFRRAHHITGEIVRRAEARGCSLAELPLTELQAVEPAITDAVYGVLDVERSVASRASFGGTAPPRVDRRHGRHACLRLFRGVLCRAIPRACCCAGAGRPADLLRAQGQLESGGADAIRPSRRRGRRGVGRRIATGARRRHPGRADRLFRCRQDTRRARGRARRRHPPDQCRVGARIAGVERTGEQPGADRAGRDPRQPRCRR